MTYVCAVKLAWSLMCTVVRATQAALTVGGLSEVVQSPARGLSLVSRNKEGLLSIPGYWALHLLSSGLGHWIRSGASAAAARAVAAGDALDSGREARLLSLRPLYGWLAATIGVALALEGITAVLAAAVEPVSRRACNAAYIAWMLAFNTQASSHMCLAGLIDKLNCVSLAVVLDVRCPSMQQQDVASKMLSQETLLEALGCCITDVRNGDRLQRTQVQWVQVLAAFAAAQLLGQQPVPRLLQAINANMLPIFLAANVLTGVINLSLNTLSVNDWAARGMVTCYMLCLCFVAEEAYRTKRSHASSSAIDSS